MKAMRPFVVMNPTAGKVKVADMFMILIIWWEKNAGKCIIYRKKITATYNSFEKMYPIKGLQSPCQKCMDKFSDPYYILMN